MRTPLQRAPHARHARGAAHEHDLVHARADRLEERAGVRAGRAGRRVVAVPAGLRGAEQRGRGSALRRVQLVVSMDKL